MGSPGRKMKHFVTFFAFFLTFYTQASGKLTKIEENNWQDLLTGEWMVEFFAPWCPACRGLQPTWEDFSGWSEDLDIGIGQVDVTTSPGLSGRFMVTALPTIFHVKDGVFRQYRGARDKDSFISFVAFAVATILLGGILGLILVRCIDCVYPPRRDDELHHHVQQATRPDKKD